MAKCTPIGNILRFVFARYLHRGIDRQVVIEDEYERKKGERWRVWVMKEPNDVVGSLVPNLVCLAWVEAHCPDSKGKGRRRERRLRVLLSVASPMSYL